MPTKRFAITGVAGYVAPRHLRAIAATGHRLVAALDPQLGAGRFAESPAEVEWFSEERRFGEHLARLHRAAGQSAVDYVAICSPSQFHEAQARFALEAGADVVCEKPVMLEPSGLDALAELERRTGRRVWSVLQMRLHPGILRLAESLQQRRTCGQHEVTLTYVTARGPWYFESWKGDERRSGGLLTNIGIHFFDLLLWLFGRAVRYEVHHLGPQRAGGFLELERARVSWLLSIDPEDLPWRGAPERGSVHRALTVDGIEVDFSVGAGDLHTRLYERVLEGNGFGLGEARPSLELVHRLRHARVVHGEPMHSFLERRAVAG